jgi:hypothetical protein
LLNIFIGGPLNPDLNPEALTKPPNLYGKCGGGGQSPGFPVEPGV